MNNTSHVDCSLADGVRVTINAEAIMRDGTILRADIYRPPREGLFPVLLMRVPYNKAGAQSFVYQHPSWYARQGFIVVIQDCRGRYASDGVFDPLRNEATDGYDAVEWAARIEESNGRVGMYGFSYAGATQLLAASEQPPSLVCCIPAFTAADYFDGWMYDGGAFNLAFVVSWSVQMLAAHEISRAGNQAAAPLIRARLHDFPALFRERPLEKFPLFAGTNVAPYFFDWLKHDSRDAYWEAIGLPERYDNITVPCLHIGGWFDVFGAGTVRNFAELSQRAGDDPHREQRLIMGPWVHTPWSPEAAGPDLGESFANRVEPAQLSWLNRWLKGDEADASQPAVEYFVMGRNSWTHAPSWPAAAQTTEFFLDSGGRANSRSGDGTLVRSAPGLERPMDVVIADPNMPVVSAGGHSCCNSVVAPMGQACQTSVEVRNEVLVYTSGVVEQSFEVTGTPEVVLFAATTAPDFDVVVRLVDVSPDGRALNVTQGVLRASFRESLAEPKPLVPNKVTEFCIKMRPTSWQFRAGHRVRLQVTGTDFPSIVPNTHTGDRPAAALPGQGVVATQMVFHDRDRPSALRLPVRPVGRTPTGQP